MQGVRGTSTNLEALNPKMAALSAWEAGRVPKGEFVNRARAIGVTGAVAGKFRAFGLRFRVSLGFTG